MPEKDAKLEQAFELLMARAGVTVPPDRRAGVFEEFVGFQPHIERIWACPLPPSVEPALTFSVTPAPKRTGKP
jgi:hypothetical protein